MKHLAALFLCIVVCAVCPAVYAHPPSDITITYDTTTKVLKAVISHEVSNPEKHYIAKVEVDLNGKEVIAHQLSRQDNFNTQTVSYLIPDAGVWDKLSVEASCSISGKLKKEIQVLINS